ncbi:MAG TPA: TetR/AcrR family transcriptional regulator [Candidatus Fimivicinus intestinavium]|nr:TetR/AcrR family transcriptional regulator [Candidatus Fimivicinus intestinavium]
MDVRRKRDKFDAMREDAIERILSASMQLFSECGYAATTIQMIADRARVVPSGIYHYYAGKAELLKAVVDRLVKKVEAFFTNSDVSVSRKTDMVHFLDYSVQVLKENIADVQLLTMLILQKDTPPDCSGKVTDIIQFIGQNIPQFEMDERSREDFIYLLEDLFAATIMFAVSKNEQIYDRQMRVIRERLQCIFARDTVSEAPVASSGAER